jgi:hypothetical protein
MFGATIMSAFSNQKATSNKIACLAVSGIVEYPVVYLIVTASHREAVDGNCWATFSRISLSDWSNP